MSIEINVSDFIRDEDPTYYADSIHNSGLENIGEITWQRAMDRAGDESEPQYLDTPEKLDEFADQLKSTGGWTRDEIDEFTDQELNALFLQSLSSELQQTEPHLEHVWLDQLTHADIDLLEHEWQNGQLSGRLYPVIPDNPEDPTRWFYTIGE